MAYNILLVDDSKTARAIQRKILGLADVPLGEIFEAGNGLEALELLAQNWIDLVLTDLNMPEMGGTELIELMKQDEAMAMIPVVVISTEGSETRVEQLMVKGIHSYLRKPFTPEDLKTVIDEILGGGNDGGS